MIDPFDDESLRRAADIANDETLSLDEALTALSSELGVPTTQVSDELARIVFRRVKLERLLRSIDADGVATRQ